jgi:hypothetical protein
MINKTIYHAQILLRHTIDLERLKGFLYQYPSNDEQVEACSSVLNKIKTLCRHLPEACTDGEDWPGITILDTPGHKRYAANI